MPNYKVFFNMPARLKKPYQFLAQNAQPEDVILSVWTYSTQFYTKCKATWPHGVSPYAPPTELFYERDPEEFSRLLDRSNITYVLLDETRVRYRFNSVSYPTWFVENIEVLVQKGKMNILRRFGGVIIVKNIL